jgi:hypothetical protein
MRRMVRPSALGTRANNPVGEMIRENGPANWELVPIPSMDPLVAIPANKVTSRGVVGKAKVVEAIGDLEGNADGIKDGVKVGVLERGSCW